MSLPHPGACHHRYSTPLRSFPTGSGTLSPGALTLTLPASWVIVLPSASSSPAPGSHLPPAVAAATGWLAAATPPHCHHHRRLVPLLLPLTVAALPCWGPAQCWTLKSLRGWCVKLGVATLGVQLDINDHGTQAISVSAATAGQLHPGTVFLTSACLLDSIFALPFGTSARC